jgi:hypothetical protein
VALIETLTEDWTTITEVTKWNKWGGGNVTNPGGVLQIVNTALTGNYYGIGSINSFDFTGSSLSCELVAVPTIQAGDGAFAATLLNAEIDSNNRFFIEWNINGLSCMKVTAGAYAEVATVPKADFTIAGYRYVRMVQTGTDVVYQYSTTGYSGWTTLGTTAVGITLTAMYVVIALGQWDAAVANTYSFQVDNLNLMPTAPVTANPKMLMMFN